jgi:hypothetical protein
LAIAATAAAAQAVIITADNVVDPATAVITEILDRGNYLLLERDTVLGDDAVITGDLVIIGGAVRLEGRIDGGVAVIYGDLFVRPGAVISGPIATAGGAVHGSGLAEMGPVLAVPLDYDVVLDRPEGGYALIIDLPPAPPPLAPSGIFGFGLPTYDRVNGLTARWGGSLLLGEEDTFVSAKAAYHTARNTFSGEASAEVPLGGGYVAVANIGRKTNTNEEWIRGAFANTLGALFLKSDARDYYESDQVSVGFESRPVQPLIQGESFLGPRLLVRASRDRSLTAADPWSVLGDDPWRANPAIDDGTIVSVEAGVELGWRGVTSSFDGDLALEGAPGGAGDFEFAQTIGSGHWAMLALWGHVVDIYGRAMMPLGSQPAPRQRWSFVGGTNTLPTFEFGDIRGDHLVFIRSAYSIPMRRFDVPFLGIPALRAVHAVGSAWVTDGESPRWEQNLGGGVAFPLLEAILYVNPSADDLSPTFSLGFTFPF